MRKDQSNMAESQTQHRPPTPAAKRGILLLVFVLLAAFAVYEYITISAPPPAVENFKSRPVNSAGQLRFAVIGDYGKPSSGLKGVAKELAAQDADRPMDFVLSVGDVLYKNDEIQSIDVFLKTYFSPLLDRGVPFYNALGNHDVQSRDYEAILNSPLLNMQGRHYYKVSDPQGLLDIFILDSNTLENEFKEDAQYDWLDKELESSRAAWKCVALHTPIYSSKAYHGPSPELIRQLAPRLMKNHVDFVLSGHNHFYERIPTQDGIRYFIVGGSSRDSSRIIPKDAYNEVGYARKSTFMVVDLDREKFRFHVINSEGTVIDTGAWAKGKPNDLFDVHVADEVTSAGLNAEPLPLIGSEEEEY
jgi:3',5'-cyclic AMP phosphodiesterase CpdA